MLTKRIPSTEAQRDRLQPYKNELINLASSRVPFKQKQQILVQQGAGFIQDLLSPLLSGISWFLLYIWLKHALFHLLHVCQSVYINMLGKRQRTKEEKLFVLEQKSKDHAS